MIDLNSAFGFLYGGQLPSAATSQRINALIDSALAKHNRRHLGRNYCGDSRFGSLHDETVCFGTQALFDKATDVIGAAKSGQLSPRIPVNADFYLCQWRGFANRRCEAAL